MHNNLGESPGSYDRWEKANFKGHILYDSIYTTFLKWQILELENRLVVDRHQGWQAEEKEEGVAIKGQPLTVMELFCVL